MTPEELNGLSRPETPAVHPSGDRVAYVKMTINTDDDRYDRSIWMAQDGASTRFTAGPGDSQPRWSPDGSHMAFLRKVDDANQIAVIAADGGEAEVVTAFALGVRSMEWSPDGSLIVAAVAEPTEEWADLTTEERDRKPRRVTQVPYRFDGEGWLHDRVVNLHLIDPFSVEASTRLTSGAFDDQLPTWHPSGDSVAFLSNLLSDQSRHFGAAVVSVDIASGDTTELVAQGNWVAIRYSEAGDLYVLGDPSQAWPRVSSLWRWHDGELSELTGHLDRSAAALSAGAPFIEIDGDIAYVHHEDRGSVGVVRVHPDGTVDHLVAGQFVVSSFSTAAGTTAHAESTPTDPGTLVVASASGEYRLSHPAHLDLIEPDHFTVVSDGAELDVWVYLPDGDNTVPLLLNIHGGPASQYGFGFFDEFQVYADAGYGVVACNPRGSSGRGDAHLRAVVETGWGEVDVADVNAAVDAALARHPRLDSERMGIMGGSYGGFLTAWIIASDHRWKAAVVERALLSFNSFAGTSDIGGSFPRHYIGADHGDENADARWAEKSPLTRASSTTTPTLVIHSENDFRCPIEQAERYFMTLLRAGATTEFLRFPGEGHELTRSGKPRHRVERFDAILEWYERHL